jgi:uncharacterized protein YkwD
VLTQNPSPAARGRRRRLAPLGVAIAALAVVLSACTPQQLDTFQRINYDRMDHGVEPLSIQDSLMAKAQAWAEYLAGTAQLAHSNLADGAAPGWWMLGENVGYGPSYEAIEAAFMNSPAHRANILNPEFNYAGTGVAVGRNGLIYLVQVFGRY